MSAAQMVSVPQLANVTVNFLGNFSVTINGNAVRRWRAGKTRSLFQYLLVNREKVVSREKLYEVLWPGAAWSPRSSSLKVAMHGLRQILLTQQEGGQEAALAVVHQDYGYVLRARDVWVDFEKLEKAYEAGRAAELRGRRDEALRMYQRVVELYRGDFLEGESADWIYEQREWIKTMALRALGTLSTSALQRNDHQAVIRWCRRALEIDPYQEETYQTLIAVHGRLGELGSVKRWFDLCAMRLREGLDVEPAEATVRAFQQAVRRTPTLRPMRAGVARTPQRPVPPQATRRGYPGMGAFTRD